MRLGFIGFGGAAYGLAKGLSESGSFEISFFDVRSATSAAGRLIAPRAEETGAQARENLDALVNNSDEILDALTSPGR
jgi:3-hydroxyisobutyrate dehydrogenase-like beta-hydroxyacid dehydrogenase